MKLKTKTTLGKNIYNFLKKTGLENKFELENLIQTHCPEIFSKLQTGCKKEKIALCATNGKKTILNLFNQILRANNDSFMSNLSKEASLVKPMLCGLLAFCDDNKEYDYYSMAYGANELFDCFNLFKFNTLLLHNLFLEQTNYDSLVQKRKKIQEALFLNPELNLIINGDEPMFYEIDEINNETIKTTKRNKLFYGFRKIEYLGIEKDLSQKNDVLSCPVCSSELNYKQRFYSHLGEYHCECGFKRPKLDFEAEAKIYNDCTFLNVFYKERKYIFKVPLGGLYNAYNALGAIALALSLDIERKVITSVFDNYSPLKARDHVIDYKNKKIKLKVIKNPVSLSESIKELYNSTSTKAVFCLNDLETDGIDTSWIWDSNFDSLANFSNKIYLTSNRLDDLALRLKYAGVNPCFMTMDSSIKNIIKCCYWELEKDETMLILATPSLVDKIYKHLQ